MQLDAARRREQADKLAAISALERQSAEIMRHKAAMAALQGRISLMQSQLLVGGHRVEDTPQFRQLLAAEQDRIRGQYQARLAELEAEREVMAEGHAQVCWEGERRGSRQREKLFERAWPGWEDGGWAAGRWGALLGLPSPRAARARRWRGAALHATLCQTQRACPALQTGTRTPTLTIPGTHSTRHQVERYRVLLCKQRDIMTALTQRLGERDGQVLALQGKLDAALARQRCVRV